MCCVRRGKSFKKKERRKQYREVESAIGIMADPDDSEPEEEPLARTTSIGLSHKVPAKREQSEESARAVARA